MKKAYFLIALLAALAIILLTTNPLQAREQSHDDGLVRTGDLSPLPAPSARPPSTIAPAQSGAHSTGIESAADLGPESAPAALAPMAPAMPGNIYGDEIRLTSTTARFPLNAPANMDSIAPYAGSSFAGTFGADPDNFYAIDSSSTLESVNAATGARTAIGTVTGISGTIAGMTYDLTTGTYYLATTTCSSSNLYTLDVVSAVATLVGPMTNTPCAIAIAIDGSGDLYAHDIINDTIVSVNKATGTGLILGPTGFNANFAQGMAYDSLSDTIFLAAYNDGDPPHKAELRSVNTSNGSTTFLGKIGPVGVEFGYAAIPLSGFSKRLVGGNDLNSDGKPDLVVEAGTNFFGANYLFSISYLNPGGPTVTIKDVVPREWRAGYIGGSAPCEVVTAERSRNLVTDNYVTCYPDDADVMYILAEARCNDNPTGGPACHPMECGAFYLNEGAIAWAGRTPVGGPTNALCLAAVRDVNGGGLDYTGAGDEDGDGVSDYHEACVNFTDPCVYDLPPDCVEANGLLWCFDNATCGKACNDVCAVKGLTPVADSNAWFEAQNTPAECQNIADAFGGGLGISIGGNSYACAEDAWFGVHAPGSGLHDYITCSTSAGCPDLHREDMDQLGVDCGIESRRSVCPCE